MLANIRTDKNEDLEALIYSIYLQKLLTHDPYTYYHSIRVGCLMSAFGTHLGLSSDITESLYFSGLLHDIGKLNVSKKILSKPGSLTEAEWESIKAHPIEGFNLLSPSLSDSIFWDVIRYHHENYDGSGYPFKLVGEEIPYYAQIARIVDTFDAMTTHRSYNKKRSVNATLRTIEDSIGYGYEPQLSRSFIDFAYTLK